MNRPAALAPLALLACLALAGAASAQEPPVLELPLECEIGSLCMVQNYVDTEPGPGAKDYRCGPLVYDGHRGTDIRTRSMADMREGIAVVAAAPGVVKALRDGMADVSLRVVGEAAIKGREAGNGVVVDHGGGWETQYSHMRKGSIAVRRGQRVEAGDKLGLIGLSGKTEFPHLHFELRHDGRRIDPFTGLENDSGCGPSGPGLWSGAAAAALAYRAGGLLDAGFADRPVEIDELLEGEHRATRLPAESRALVFWAFAYGLRGGDRQTMRLLAPDGTVVAEKQSAVPRNKAQWMSFVGRKVRGQAWPAGRYHGLYRVERDGSSGPEVVIDIEREIEIH